MDYLFSWLFDVLRSLADVGQWLISPLPYINMAPLMLLTLAGVTTLLGIHLVKLFL